MKRALIFAFCLLSFPAIAPAEIYTIEDEFDGCEHGKIYPFTNGKFMRHDSYKCFYKYRSKVFAYREKVIAVDEQGMCGMILHGEKFSTQLDSN